MKSKEKSIAELCRVIWEMNKQAPYDFGGEQRDFYLPRLTEAMVAVGVLFPSQFADAVLKDDE